jgi:copper transport protein
MMIRKVIASMGGIGLAVGLLLSQALVAAAHANYVRSVPDADSASPIAPRSVQVWFSEQVDPAASVLSVHDSTGKTVDNADSHVAPDDSRSLIITLKALGNGTYTVVWQTLSAVDGHEARGSFPFTVGEARASANYTLLVDQMERSATALQPPPLADTVVRWLTLLALLLVAGGFAYTPYAMSAPALRPLRAATAGRRRQVLWLSLGLLCLALVAGAVLRTVETGIASALSGRFGIVVAGRAVLMLILAGLLWRRCEETRLVAIPGALLLLSQSALSHGAAEVDWLLPTFTDWMHLTSAAIWLGGVAMLAVVIAPCAVADRARLKELGIAIVKFSPYAVASVVVIYVTGLIQSIWLLGSLDALVTTAYGRILAIKIVLALVLVGFGAFHQLFVAPDLQPQAGKSGARAQRSGKQFRTTIVAEAIVFVVLLAAAGGLTSLPPGRDLVPGPGSSMRIESRTADDLSLTFGVTPSKVGDNQFAVRLSTANGSPIGNVEEVLLRFTSLDMDMGQSEMILKPYGMTGAAYYTGQSSLLSMDGRWRADLIVRRTGKADAHATFVWPVTF